MDLDTTKQMIPEIFGCGFNYSIKYRVEIISSFKVA